MSGGGVSDQETTGRREHCLTLLGVGSICCPSSMTPHFPSQGGGSLLGGRASPEDDHRVLRPRPCCVSNLFLLVPSRSREPLEHGERGGTDPKCHSFVHVTSRTTYFVPQSNSTVRAVGVPRRCTQRSREGVTRERPPSRGSVPVPFVF